MDRLFPRFFRPPGVLPPEHSRFFLVLNYCTLLAIALHGSFIPLFLLLDVTPLAAFNLLSVGLWVAAALLNRNGYPLLALTLATTEVTAHAIASVVLLGPGAAFQFYLLLVSPVVFVAPRLATPAKAALVAATGLVFLGLNGYDLAATAQMPLDATSTQLLAFGNIAMTFTVLASLTYYHHRIATRAESELRRLNGRLEALAHTDELTGLMNRRAMMEFVEAEAARSDRTERPYAVVLIDVDNFKGINDHHGHAAGDRVLVELARTMATVIRRTDQLARWGGEEFLLLLPETDRDGALEVAEKLRESVAAAPIRFANVGLVVTLTLGVCVCHDSADHCIVNADHALYEGKRKGKNRTVLSTAA